MMTISVSDAGKRFNRDWIFRKLSYDFISGNSYAITGPNGSGKSTLLQVIAGAVVMSEGSVKYEVGRQEFESSRQKSEVGSRKSEAGSQKADSLQIAADNAFKYISITAPYLDVIEEMTVEELLKFHEKFKPFIAGYDERKIVSIVGLENAANKQIRYYSSGMKQRVKLAQAIFSNTPCVLLDEPCTNLDAEGIALYRRLIAEYCKSRLVIVSSNDEQEYDFCNETLNILKWK